MGETVSRLSVSFVDGAVGSIAASMLVARYQHFVCEQTMDVAPGPCLAVQRKYCGRHRRALLPSAGDEGLATSVGTKMLFKMVVGNSRLTAFGHNHYDPAQ